MIKNQLNPEQHEGVHTYLGPVMILAGAGTGKTKVITHRIAYMISIGISPETIVAVTFTNKAAREMKERLALLVGNQKAKKTNVSTFHSFCLQILRRWPKKASLRSHFSLVGMGDQLELVKKALEEKGWHGIYRPDLLLTEISMCKNKLLLPEDLNERAPLENSMVDPEVLKEVYGIYEKLLNLNHAIDFDDCIFKVVKALQNDESFCQMLQERFQYFLVDEFQDTNASQFAVIEYLVAKHKNICVVGDDDQSIYSWRGAVVEVLENFEKCFEGTKLIKLEQNYRCSPLILKAANSVIQNNSQRKSKTLWSGSEKFQPIYVYQFEDAQQEADWVGEKCLALKGQGKSYGNISVIYRTNSQAKLIEMSMRKNNIPYQTIGGQSFFERKEIKDFLAYVRLCLNEFDQIALWRVINYPHRGIGLKTQETLKHCAQEFDFSPTQFLLKFDRYQERVEGLTASSKNSILQFSELVKAWKDVNLTTTEGWLQLGKKILEQAGIIEDIKAKSKNQMKAVHLINSIKSLPEWLEQAAKDYQEKNGDIDPLKLCDTFSLNQLPENKEKDHNNQVTLMTIHSAKGLEFENVFITGLEDGTIPHKNSIEANAKTNAIAEERRLLYVAITRAKENLFLTHTAMRQTGFTKEKRKRSRFLSELPQDDPNIIIKDIGATLEEDKEKKVTNTLKKLSSLREEFINS